jgi:hypothetical protein
MSADTKGKRADADDQAAGEGAGQSTLMTLRADSKKPALPGGEGNGFLACYDCMLRVGGAPAGIEKCFGTRMGTRFCIFSVSRYR